MHHDKVWNKWLKFENVDVFVDLFESVYKSAKMSEQIIYLFHVSQSATNYSKHFYPSMSEGLDLMLNITTRNSLHFYKSQNQK